MARPTAAYTLEELLREYAEYWGKQAARTIKVAGDPMLHPVDRPGVDDSAVRLAREAWRCGLRALEEGELKEKMPAELDKQAG